MKIEVIEITEVADEKTCEPEVRAIGEHRVVFAGELVIPVRKARHVDRRVVVISGAT